MSEKGKALGITHALGITLFGLCHLETKMDDVVFIFKGSLPWTWAI